ncbi:MAG: tetratricopeptide repeat protein [Phycisphaerae bacterium]|nr:tetratricopeptide repeat protein [Phycisphaerae bacterium]NUQ47068.1 tetratricopeptide repeat protein [Phycisphaerae bacterium]
MRHNVFAALLATVFLSLSTPALAVTHLRRGDTPPPIALSTLDDQPFTIESHRRRVVVLLFGELYHARTLEACRIVDAIRSDPRIDEVDPDCVLIAAQQAEREALRTAARDAGVTMPVLHDRDRNVFAVYRVSVLPSVVVLDRAGRVVHAAAGLSASFREVLTDAILLAGEKLAADQFERTLHPASGPAESESARRAARVTELGRQLSRGGMNDLAADKFREALTIEPTFAPARIALGRLALQRRQLAEAEKQFREALAVDPESPEPTLGLAYVQALRGGDELPKAEQQVRSLLARRPNDAEAHYLLGMIHEQSDRPKEAAASYRKAAELLFEQGAAR